MTDFTIRSFPEGNIDKNYSTGNWLIRKLLNRLLIRISDTLSSIDAKSAKGLEVGCGEGNIIHYLRNRGTIGDMTAVDLQINKLKFAAEHVPYANYVNADISHLVFKNHVFDYIMAIEIFEHLSHPSKALSELKRVAEKGAHLLISVPHEPFFHWGNLARGKYLNRMGKTPSHVHFWNKKQFKRFIREHVDIIQEHYLATFPWMFFLCRFTA